MNKYDFGEQIGELIPFILCLIQRGNYSNVRIAVNKITRNRFAAKEIDKSKLNLRQRYTLDSLQLEDSAFTVRLKFYWSANIQTSQTWLNTLKRKTKFTSFWNCKFYFHI